MDPTHNKNLYKHKNKSVLRDAEAAFGGRLPQNSNLPHLICRPCERILHNFVQFRLTITNTQTLLQEEIRTKHCPEILPLVEKPPPKVCAAGAHRQRSIDFGSEPSTSLASAQDQSQDSTPISLLVSLFFLYS